MAYAAPTIGQQGLTIPSYTDARDALLDAFRAAYPQNTYLALSQDDYQWISAWCLKLADALSLGQLVYNGRSLVTAVGADLDALGSYFATYRKQATASSVAVTLAGTPLTEIDNGVVQDVNGNTWSLPQTVIIPASGSIVVTATATSSGAIAAAVATVITKAAGLTAGWLSVTNAAAAVPGQDPETDSQYRARLASSVALPSTSMVAGTVARVLAVSGVTRINIDENPSSQVDANGVPGHTVSVVVEGGTDADVALAIYQNKGIGCGTYGTTTVQVTDPSNGGLTLPISFSRPAAQPVYVSLGIHALSSAYTSATQSAITGAVAAYLNSLQIGETLTVSGIYFAIAAVLSNISEPSFSLRSVSVGTNPAQLGGADLVAAYNAVFIGAAGNVAIVAV